MKRIVIVDLAGGIGNQIFLFEMANFISRIDNRVILINKSHIDKKHSNGNSTIEDFILPVHAKFFNLYNVIRIFYVKLGLVLKILNQFKQSIFLVLDESYNLGSSADIRNIVLQRNPKIILVTGFWQNFSYWHDDFDYKLKVEGSRYKELLNRLSTENPVVVHYRIGRINGAWENPWGALSPKYVIESLNSLEKEDKNFRPIWIFSNDINEAKNLFSTTNFAPSNTVFVDDSELRPSEIILLLSKSWALICSNSTFSIVAAKIGKVPNVTVPSNLSRTRQSNILFPVSWHKVTSEWLDA